MLSAETWELLHRYKEFTINGLDLISFFFVTPELVRYLRPLVNRVPLFLFYIFVWGSALFSAFFMVTSRLHIVAPASKHDAGIAALIAVAAATIAAIITILSIESVTLSRAGGWLARHLLFLGVVTFLASRSFAFLIAAHELAHP